MSIHTTVHKQIHLMFRRHFRKCSHIFEAIFKLSTMSELIQELRVPAKTTIAREFPGSDMLNDHPFCIKFGDFEVQVMDNNMKTILVFLDDQLFVDGKMVEGSPGDSFPSKNNNHHLITADKPLLSTANLDGPLIDQGQDLQEHALGRTETTTADDLRKSVLLCNNTIADLVDKKLLKFTKSKWSFFKKQTTAYSREREEVLKSLHRISEQSRQVAQNEENIKHQLKIKQRIQVVLEKIIANFGKELQKNNYQILELTHQLESTNIKCQELKDLLDEDNSRYAEELKQKETQCQEMRKGQTIMDESMKEKDHTLHDLTNEVSTLKRLVKSLETVNGELESKNTSLLDVIAREKEMHQKDIEAKERLLGDKRSLESGIEMMEARMRQQRKYYEDGMKKMQESHEMEITKMKKTMDAEMAKRDEVFKDVCHQLTEEQKRHESLKAETAVVNTRLEEQAKQNKEVRNKLKLVEESLNCVTDEKTKLIVLHQEQVDYLHKEMTLLEEKLTKEERSRAIVEELHQRLIISKKTEEDRFLARQAELFLRSCADNAALFDTTTQIEKKHLEQAAEADRRCTHLRENNKNLQSKLREGHERYLKLYNDFEKLQRRHVDEEKKTALFQGAPKDHLSTRKIDPRPRVKELECKLVKKTEEQEDMRVLIRWLKKDLSKAEKDVARSTSEKQNLVVNMMKERADYKQEVDHLKKIFAQEKTVQKNAYEMRNSENRRIAKKMTDLHRQLKISHNDLQKSKNEADEEIKRLKACVNDMEDEMEEMDEELENYEQDIEELEDDLDDAEYEIEQKEKQVRKLKTQVDDLLKTKRNLERILRSFQTKT